MQVTAYAHKDENNRFLVKKWNSEGRPELDFLDPNRMNETMEIELVRHGDLIRLEHVVTRRNVHTHSEKAPLSKKQFQVTGYGEVGSDQDDLRFLLHNLSRLFETLNVILILERHRRRERRVAGGDRWRSRR